MSEKLRDFLTNLAENPAVREGFKNDPHGVMDEHGLTDEHKKMVLESDKEGVKREIGADDAEVNKFIF